jgi:hypothetical protein
VLKLLFAYGKVRGKKEKGSRGEKKNETKINLFAIVFFFFHSLRIGGEKRESDLRR